LQNNAFILLKEVIHCKLPLAALIDASIPKDIAKKIQYPLFSTFNANYIFYYFFSLLYSFNIKKTVIYFNSLQQKRITLLKKRWLKKKIIKSLNLNKPLSHSQKVKLFKKQNKVIK
jgi:hypothetical protein